MPYAWIAIAVGVAVAFALGFWVAFSHKRSPDA